MMAIFEIISATDSLIQDIILRGEAAVTQGILG